MTAGLRPHGRTLGTFSFLVVLGSFLAAPVFASGESEQLSGRVLDPDGRPVPYAEVVISTTSSLPQNIDADAEGRFSFNGLAPGRYELRASAPGLVADPVNVELADGANASSELTLRVSAVTEALVVSASQIDQPLSRTPDSVTVIAGGDI